MKGVRGVDSSPLPDSYKLATKEEPQPKLIAWYSGLPKT